MVSQNVLTVANVTPVKKTAKKPCLLQKVIPQFGNFQCLCKKPWAAFRLTVTAILFFLKIATDEKQHRLSHIVQRLNFKKGKALLNNVLLALLRP